MLVLYCNAAPDSRLQYPDTRLYLGAYKDVDEDFRLFGKLRSAMLYYSATSAETFRRHYEAGMGYVPGDAATCECDGLYHGQFCTQFSGTFTSTTATTTTTVTTSTISSTTSSTTSTSTTSSATTMTSTRTTSTATSTSNTFTLSGCGPDQRDPDVCNGQRCDRDGVPEVCPQLCDRCSEHFASVAAAAEATDLAVQTAIAELLAQQAAATAGPTPESAAPAASTGTGTDTGSSSGHPAVTAAIILAVIAVAAIVFALVTKHRGSGTTDRDGAAAFENPLYGDTHVQASTSSQQGERSGYMDVAGSRGDTTTYSEPSGGYMDVSPTAAVADDAGDAEEDV